MKQVRIGVLGAYRGTSMIHYCLASGGKAKVVAICDKSGEALARQKKELGEDIAYYADFEDFIRYDMDAVVLANYANEHAPFAVRCLDRGLHVFSEVLPCQTPAEAVTLVEAVERSGKVYAYGENYCFIPAVYEMRRRYRAGEIGSFEYGEGEYVHNCEPIWASITYGERDHWRNNMYATFYCTHSLGPIVHITGERPVSVVGFESPLIERKVRNGAKSGLFGIEMVTFSNGAIAKSIHGDLYRNSVWYSIYGSKGRLETAREDSGKYGKLFVNADAYSGEYRNFEPKEIDPEEKNGKVEFFGHGGSDFYIMDQFVDKIRGGAEADVIDVYEALDMFLPGLFAYRSVLRGGVSVEVPDFRDPAVRERYRGDNACTDPAVAGDQLLPVFSGGTPEIADEVYEEVRRKWDAERADGEYVRAVAAQGKIEK